ncbi:hypothetical protein [Nocardia sp. NPDC020380]|uniref:hypothetical protein n=1 Tax=Nocardia sp. NPDC020380 TaxID=3364309 RepID=UPI00378E4465
MAVIFETAPLAETCEVCGSEMQCSVTEAVVNIGPRWDMECGCSSCGNNWHTGGFGTSPGFVRKAIIAQNGLTKLKLAESGGNNAAVAKVLRDTLSLPLSEIATAVRKIRTDGYEGSLVEVHSLAIALEKAGVGFVIDRSE